MGKLFIYVQRSFTQNLRLFGWKIREVWIIRKIHSVAGSRVEHPKQKNNVAFISSPCSSCTCSMSDARRGHRVFFLIIHNSRISHPNNLKLWKKLLCTYMNNFLTGSFLYAKHPLILFVGKIRKTRITARINFLLNMLCISALTMRPDLRCESTRVVNPDTEASCPTLWNNWRSCTSN